jgi:hypothetical protein
MERYINKLDRASNVFKLFTVFAFFLGLFRLAVILLPSLGLAGMFAITGSTGGAVGVGLTAINALIAIVSELLSIGFVMFCLYTTSLVLEFLAQVGEDLHSLRQAEWERRQIAGGKTQRIN